MVEKVCWLCRNLKNESTETTWNYTCKMQTSDIPESPEYTVMLALKAHVTERELKRELRGFGKNCKLWVRE